MHVDQHIGLTLCVLTFHREKFLGELLESLYNQRGLDRFDLEIVVVDTSGIGSSRSVVSSSALASSIRFIESKSRLTIPSGRNLALESASRDWIFFVDDDQYFKQQVIEEIGNRLASADSGMIAAKLGVSMDFGCESWMQGLTTYARDIPFVDKVRMPFDSLSTDGVIFRRDVAEARGIKFDKFWARDGGEDNDFFVRLLSEGGWAESWSKLKLVDRVMKDRMTLKYCMKDSYRKGLCRSKLCSRVFGQSKFVLILKAVLVAFIQFILCPFAFLLGRAFGWNMFLKGWRQVGKLSGVFGASLGMYEEPSNVSDKV